MPFGAARADFFYFFDQVLREPLMRHATSFGGGKSYISFPARNRPSKAESERAATHTHTHTITHSTPSASAYSRSDGYKKKSQAEGKGGVADVC